MGLRCPPFRRYHQGFRVSQGVGFFIADVEATGFSGCKTHSLSPPHASQLINVPPKRGSRMATKVSLGFARLPDSTKGASSSMRIGCRVSSRAIRSTSFSTDSRPGKTTQRKCARSAARRANPIGAIRVRTWRCDLSEARARG